jgi:hypothetical protein
MSSSTEFIGPQNESDLLETVSLTGCDLFSERATRSKQVKIMAAVAPKKDVFLPKTVIPVEYSLDLVPNLIDCTFAGTVGIDLVRYN